MRIKELLQIKGITQKEFAEMLGMTPTGLNLAIGEEGNPPLKRLKQMAELLGVPVSELFEDSSLTENITCPCCGAKFPLSITNFSYRIGSDKGNK